MTYADTKRAYRVRAREKFGKLKRYDKSLFDRGEFVAVDGEGFSDGDPIEVAIGKTVYRSVDHRYGLLMDSDGHSIEPAEGEVRLSTKQCLDFLLDITQRNKNAIPVIFGGSYDACHMLAFGLDRDTVQTLLKSNISPGQRNIVDTTLRQGDEIHDYRLEYRPRKSLTVWRFIHGADRYRRHDRKDGGTEWKLNAEARVCLWDVWGFFQGSFLAAMKNWIPDDPDWHMIRDMKGARATFERSEMATIRTYTAAELRCLIVMMERVRASIRSLDLTVTRWDGAGAIAASFFKKNNVKDHMAEAPPEVFEAARCAYSGGHIEAMFIGHHSGKVYHYDINSAYPHMFRRLPGLVGGSWTSGETDNPPHGFTLVRVEYHFRPGRPFYPLFHRSGNGSILYSERGSGWYWQEEYDVAREFAERFGAFTFRVVAWHHFQPAFNLKGGNDLPFRWIEEAYQVRRDVIMRARETGVRDDSHMMIRLGLNSCYGKTAQQVGARYEDGEIKAPAYFQIEWAGFVTAGCRAQLMRAAMQAPQHVVSFATDAIFATAPLDLPCSPEKRLGEWEAHTHEAMTIVMPGVYWLHDADGVKHFSRGFDKKTMSDCAFVLKAWRQGKTSVMVDQHRMITLGAGMMSENLWKLRGMFVTTQRELMISGANSKRYPVAMTQVRPHMELCRTRPRELMEDAGQSLASLMSAPYPIAWLDRPEEGEEEGEFTNAFLDSESHDAGEWR